MFGTGLFLFIVAVVVSLANRPERASLATATAGLFGCALMLASLCIAVSRFLP